MLLTPPESPEVLAAFYSKIRPPGPGWEPQRRRTGLPAAQSLTVSLLHVAAGVLLLFGSMFALGGFLLLQPLTGWTSLLVAVAGGAWLRQLSRRKSRGSVGPQS